MLIAHCAKLPLLLHNPQRNTEHQEGEDGGAQNDAVPTERGKALVLQYGH